jgi:hypothetical protein
MDNDFSFAKLYRISGPRGKSLLIHGKPKQLLKNTHTIGISQAVAAGPFRVRHHTKYISVFVADAGNVLRGAIRVAVGSCFSMGIAIAVNDLVIGFHLCQHIGGCIKSAFAMGNGNFQCPTGLVRRMNKYIFTDELLAGIAQQHTRQ